MWGIFCTVSVEPMVGVFFGVVALAGATSRTSPPVNTAAVISNFFMFFNVWANAPRPFSRTRARPPGLWWHYGEVVKHYILLSDLSEFKRRRGQAGCVPSQDGTSSNRRPALWRSPSTGRLDVGGRIL